MRKHLSDIWKVMNVFQVSKLASGLKNILNSCNMILSTLNLISLVWIALSSGGLVWGSLNPLKAVARNACWDLNNGLWNLQHIFLKHWFWSRSVKTDHMNAFPAHNTTSFSNNSLWCRRNLIMNEIHSPIFSSSTEKETFSEHHKTPGIFS